MSIKKYQQFKESTTFEPKIGTDTNKGKVLFIDEKTKDNEDPLVKTDLYNPKHSQNFTWFRLSELEPVESIVDPTVNNIEDSKVAAEGDNVESSTENDLKPEITFIDLMKCDIRICNVVSAEKVKDKDRLLVLTINTGFDERKVVTNIGNIYKPEDLIGKKYPFALNLKPAKIAKIDSNGMIIAATDSEGKVHLTEFNIPIGSKLV